MNSDLILPNNLEIQTTAVEAARAAGALLAEGFQQPKEIRFKGEINLVTQYDLAAEKLVVDRIRSAWPGHSILAEEQGLIGEKAPFRWYIDPLDGTTNFAHGFPVFCVSIAFEIQTESGPEIAVGVVYDPLREELFTARKGQGAFLNGAPLAVSPTEDLQKALTATGFPYTIQEKPDPVLTRFRAMCLKAQGVRRAGSAALDLAYVAAGRLDAFWEEELWPWDTAAGVLLVEEAGGRVTDFAEQSFRPEFKEILASNGRLHYNMVQVLAAN